MNVIAASLKTCGSRAAGSATCAGVTPATVESSSHRIKSVCIRTPGTASQSKRDRKLRPPVELILEAYEMFRSHTLAIRPSVAKLLKRLGVNASTFHTRTDFVGKSNPCKRISG